MELEHKILEVIQKECQWILMKLQRVVLVQITIIIRVSYNTNNLKMIMNSNFVRNILDWIQRKNKMYFKDKNLKPIKGKLRILELNNTENL